MNKIRVPATDLSFIDALRKLIRTGVIASPDLESSPLIDMQVVLERSGPGSSPARRAFVFINILQQIIRCRLEGKEAETANILFGFEGYAGVPIQDRYRAVAKLYNPYWSWENYRKEPLTRHLLAVYLALKREPELTTDLFFTNEHPRKARSGLVGQDWLLEEFDGVFTFAENHQTIESMQTRRLRAVCDQIDVYRHYAYVRERGISSAPQLSLMSPGAVTITDTYVDTLTHLRIYVTEVRFPEPVRYGESIEFTLHKRVETQPNYVLQERGQDWYGLVTLASPAVSARVALRFPTDKCPRSVWRYEDIINGLIRTGNPTDENRLSVDSSNFVSCSWADLSAGYSYGIALDW
jgi:hypothetical protein